jgi:hypothetical protein
MKSKSIEIKQALKKLGVTGKIRTVSQAGRTTVYVNDRYYGIYDRTRKTFVD